MFGSINICNKPTNRDRGHACPSDGSFGPNVIGRIYINARDAVLADVGLVMDALLIEVRQGCKVYDTVMS